MKLEIHSSFMSVHFFLLIGEPDEAQKVRSVRCPMSYKKPLMSAAAASVIGSSVCGRLNEGAAEECAGRRSAELRRLS